ncbi:unnamed protein product [Acanthoscelides obtectus]|uniref:DUF7869 domain-containing protein n=1 Tax=Acanthoscelides obtectus TaxID=200917 RepID=A0A9P0KLQ0_ACAOB|nr:unnamed protein product [Acanthoscelides obtectus]CAK1647671.1 hypothetical protein AOBTE_LOCUS15329 [Acanthoscelides obtectus]
MASRSALILQLALKEQVCTKSIQDREVLRYSEVEVLPSVPIDAVFESRSGGNNTEFEIIQNELNLRTAAIAVPPTTETDVIQDRCCGLNTEEAIFTDSQLDVPVIENIMNCSPSPTTMSTDNDPEPFVPSDSSYTPSNQASESDSEPDEVTYQPSKKQRKRKADPQLWKRSVVKTLRLSGEKYVNRAAKKDQCTVCNVFKASQNKEPSRVNFENHKRREKESLEMKENDKKRAVENKGREFRAISFDLQAILPIPFAGDSQVYYKSHLNVYNFTIYDCSNKDGICYVWNETHGSKGSSEIGTCLYKYLQSLPQTVEHVATFSDTCGGQNRNKFVSAAMLYSVNKLTNLKTIDLKFMESGHSYLEADSMHATIERARRHKKIYTTREWCLLISASRLRPRPYHVNNMQYCDFLDLQQLVECIVNNTWLNNNGEKVSWIRIKWLGFEKRSPNIIQYKYDLSADFFYEIDVSANKRRSGRKRSWDSVQLKRKYATRLPISEKKKSDLLYLLNHETIPLDYADFINNLPSTSDLSKLMLCYIPSLKMINKLHTFTEKLEIVD